MNTAYYNDGNKEDAVKFYMLTADDANKADVGTPSKRKLFPLTFKYLFVNEIK